MFIMLDGIDGSGKGTIIEAWKQHLSDSGNGIFDLKKTDYQSDFSSASDWIRNNYENSALNQEQKEHNINYIIENQLPKQGYPIVITSGSKKDGQITSQGFYYCNENGVI